MRLIGIFREFLEDLRQQRLRTTLTILGITWGTVAVTVLLAFGVGLERQTQKNFHGLGERIVILFGGRTTLPFEGFADGRSIRLREEDADLMDSEISAIAEISPEYSERNTPVRRGTAAANPNITGIRPVYGQLRNVIPDMGGRFINDSDLEGRRRVAVLGNDLKTLLFTDDEDPVGQSVYVGDIPFIVVGVTVPKRQNSSYNSRDEDRIFIPATTHRAIFGDPYIANIVYRASDVMLTKTIEAEAYRLLGRKYKFDPRDEDALSVWDTSEFEMMFSYMFMAFNIFFGIVGSFTLTVGGIGVANIMYIVVKERTREIGIRRSVGARKFDILFQFFSESAAIVAVGALLGLGVSAGLVKVMSFFPMEEFIGNPTISPMVAVTTMSLLGGIAFLAGFFPARKAANLDPVECIRY